MTETKTENAPLNRVRPSTTNPRTYFDEKALEELTESIVAHGIIQPLVARPDWCMGKSESEIAAINGAAPAPKFFEIVAGERRYRGAVRAKLETVPLVVRNLSDQAALEIQLIENLQRIDIDPFEEAAGYRKLLDFRDSEGKPVHTVQTIHDKTGKSTPRIYSRLKLLNVPAPIREAVRKGLSVLIGEAIGAIPTKEMRAAAASEILKPTDPQYGMGPMSLRQAQQFIDSNFMRSLSGAQFDQKDATLVPVIQDEGTGERIGGGACTDCPMRTGNMEAVIGKTKRPDVCTNPQCFSAKTDAFFARLQQSALAEGKKILTSAEATEIFGSDSGIRFDSDYVKLSDQVDRHDVRSDFTEKMPSWKQVLDALPDEQEVEVPSTDQTSKETTMVKRKEKFPKPQIFITRDPRGRVVELVLRDEAIAAVNLAAKHKGEKSIFDKSPVKAGTSASSSSASSAIAGGQRGGGGGGMAGISGGGGGVSAETRAAEDKKKLSFQVTLASVSAVIAAIDDKGLVKGFWDALIKASVSHAGHDGCWLICKRHGLDPKAGKRVSDLAHEGVEGAALEYGLTLPDEKMKIGYVVELLVSQRVKFSQQLGGLAHVGSFTAFAKLYGVDLGAVQKTVTAEWKKKGEPAAKSNGAAVSQGKMHWTRKPEGEFKFNENGVCENPATLVLPFPKTTRVKIQLYVARSKSGWVSASNVEFGGTGVGSGGASALPSTGRKSDCFPTARLALEHELVAVDFLLVSHQVKASVLKAIRAYVEEIKTMPGGEVISANGKDAGKSKLTKIASTRPASHIWEKITDTKFRCKGCGAAAVKVKKSPEAESTSMGFLLVAKQFRSKPCSQSELPLGDIVLPKKARSKPKKTAKAKRRPGLTPAMRKKLNAPNPPPRKATARRQGRKGGKKHE